MEGVSKMTTTAKDVKVGDSIKTNWSRIMVVDCIEITKTKSNKKRYTFRGVYTNAPKGSEYVIGKSSREDRYENTKVQILQGGK
jgi:hypothetical protein